MATINEKMSENQIKHEIENKKITSGIEKISTSLATIADNQSALENALASNAAAIKEKEEKDKKKELRTLKEKIFNNDHDILSKIIKDNRFEFVNINFTKLKYFLSILK